MPFFFSKKPASVAQDMRLATDVGSVPAPVDNFEVELLGHLDTLYGVSCRMTKSTHEAEDLVQDTVVKAMRARDQFQPGTNLKAWLLRILTNTFINRYRRGGLERDLFEGPDADSLTDGWVGAPRRDLVDRARDVAPARVDVVDPGDRDRLSTSLDREPLVQEEAYAALDEARAERLSAARVVVVAEHRGHAVAATQA